MAMEERKERRLFVQYPIVFLGDQGVGEGKLINLSMGGASIESRAAVRRGAVLTLRVHPPSSPEPIAVDQAEVTWTAGDDFGVQFLSLGTREQARLGQLVAGLLQATNRSAVA